jgi:hypothetical protein
LAFTGGAVQAASAGIRPNATGELDCNGFSKLQKTLKPTLPCTDPRTNHTQRFEHNGQYIGHDEPMVRFVSNKAGTGNDSIWTRTGRSTATLTSGSDGSHRLTASSTWGSQRAR